MAYSDEWYKGEYSSDPGCPDNDPAYHSTCGYPASSDPDEYCNEEWLGIMRAVDNVNNPDTMEPRAVYYRMHSLWVKAPVFTVSGNITQENGSGVSGVTMNFRKISGKGTVPSSVQTDVDGNWSQSGFKPGTFYRVTPAKTNFIFTPSSRNFSDTHTDLNFNGAKAITIVSPNGGEVWKRGTYHVIKWRFNGNPGPYVKIELLKNGVVNSVIHKSYPKDAWNSRYPWVIPVNQAPGKNYRIRVTSTFNSSYSDTSNKTFTITK